MTSFLIDAVAVISRFSEIAVVFLTWELAWRDYGARVAFRAFAAVFVISLISRSMSLLLSPVDDLASHYIANYFPLSLLIRLPPILLIAYLTGALTRRIFGAGKKYSLRLPTLAD